MAHKMLVDIDRCIGCWTCAMGCKVGNHLEDDEYRVEVETHGSAPASTVPRVSIPTCTCGGSRFTCRAAPSAPSA